MKTLKNNWLLFNLIFAYYSNAQNVVGIDSIENKCFCLIVDIKYTNKENTNSMLYGVFNTFPKLDSINNKFKSSTNKNFVNRDYKYINEINKNYISPLVSSCYTSYDFLDSNFTNKYEIFYFRCDSILYNYWPSTFVEYHDSIKAVGLYMFCQKFKKMKYWKIITKTKKNNFDFNIAHTSHVTINDDLLEIHSTYLKFKLNSIPFSKKKYNKYIYWPLEIEFH